MAPTNKGIRTYDKKSLKSVDVLNTLLAQNLTKRLIGKKKSKVKIKELPPKAPKTSVFLSDDSLKVNKSDTFDKLLKGNVFNPVRVVKKFVKVESSESDVSKSQIPQISVSYHSHSPIMTRNRTKQKSVIISEIDNKSSSSSASAMKSSTTFESLQIEKDNKKLNFSSLSYIQLPKIDENQAMLKGEHNARMEASYEPLFSDTFRERQTVHSSTPCIIGKSKKIVADQISPIRVSSPDPKLMKRSFDEIKKWDSSYPSINGQKAPPRPDDWKLNCQPKVYFRKDDLIDVGELVEERRESDFTGFAASEQSESWELMKSMKTKVEKEKVKVKKKIKDESSEIKKSVKTSTTPIVTRSSMRVTRSSLKKLGKKSIQNNSIYLTLRRRKVGFNSQQKIHKKRTKSISEDQSVGSSSSKSSKRGVSYCCEDLNRDLEINLPKVNNTEVSSSSGEIMSVDERKFEAFASSCSYLMEDKADVNKKQIDLGQSIISLSDDDQSIVSTSVNSTNKSLLNEKAPNIDKSLSPPRKSPLRNSTKRRVFQSPQKKKQLVILSDITLGAENSPKIRQMLKTYQNVWHDHSYSFSPKPRQLTFMESPSLCKTKEKSTSQLSDIIESSVSSSNQGPIVEPVERKRRKSIILKTGKSYRRSLSLLKRCSALMNALNAEKCSNDCDCCKCRFREKLNETRSRRTSIIVPAPIIRESSNRRKSILEIYARRKLSYVQESQVIGGLDESVRNLSLISARASLVQQHEDDNFAPVTAKDVVLRRCGQTEVLPFEQCYSRSALQHCQKIGEGVYGEVFLYRNQTGGTTVMKIIPIEGDLIVNGETQKKYDEIVTEIIISMELSNLRNNKKNCTSGFSELKAVRCIQGRYPEKLVDLWDLYDENHGSENDSPEIFPPDQQYIVLELANGGQDVESYVFNNSLQVFSMFKQTACALAVAESQLKFEHRDLHWGNILITTVDKNKTLQFCLNGKQIEIASHGIEVSIIDFTLSRVECDGVVIFNDLSLDNDLFVAKGDYQFEIYRLMQKSNGNKWETFNPYTNILWLHYLLDKAVTSTLRYKNTRTKIHKEYLGKLKKLQDEILTFHSAVDFVVNNFI